MGGWCLNALTIDLPRAGRVDSVWKRWQARLVNEFSGMKMNGARFDDVDLSGAVFRNVNLSGVAIRGAWVSDVDISGHIENVRINGVDVAPLIEAELNRRYPGREKLRPTDADGFREAWDVIERSWVSTVEHLRGLPPEMLHEGVDGEWSAIENLRHLVFATDAWVKRAILGDPNPYDPLDLPHDEMEDEPGVPRDKAARPTLDEVLVLRADRMAVVRKVIDGLTDEMLAGMTNPVPAPGYPAAGSYAVQRCLRAILNEEWEHRLFIERDVAVLEERRRAT